jgi:UDP-N-acetylmuramate dehydrogenase
MKIVNNISLKKFNTFGIDAKANFFTEVKTVEELQKLLQNSEIKELPKLILGGGSNLLFTKDFEGLVLKINLMGIEKVKEDDSHIYLTAGAGENWHQFVLYCIERNFAGVENLSLIPGTVGAAPMQNIGAYGVEIKDVFHQLEAIEIATGESRTFSKEECEFAYRYSIFKDEAKAKDKYIITSVSFRLNKKPAYNTSYGDIHKTLEKMEVKELSIKAISDAVVHIRQSKLPDPAVIGNAGSFFKNPTILKSDFEKLKEQYPEIPGYHLPNDEVKVPAGWLIEQCGWKGKVIDKIGVHKNQALVLVNYGGGKGEDLRKLAFDIQSSVVEKFGIELMPEVNIV